MDLNEAARRIAARVAGLASENVGVETSHRPDELTVHVWSRHPIAYWNAWFDLRTDGTVQRPEPDDGCTVPGHPATPVDTAASLDEAVELVVAEAEKLAAGTRRILEGRLGRRPSPQPPVADADLAVACALWQDNRDDGSSLIRGAARALTGLGHYFRAGFITEQEKRARRAPEALRAAVALLRGVNGSEFRDADGWNAACGLPARGLAGRGLKAKPQDDQILKQLGYGEITMPLWGVSLDRSVAEGYGTRFLFELVGEFPAIPAWQASGIKDDEQELVTGGRYRVLSMEDVGSSTRVRLEWIEAAGALIGSDPLLLDVLGALDGVWHSELGRFGKDGAALEVRFGDSGNSATVTRNAGADEVEVVRYWPPGPGWDRMDDSVYSQHRAMLDASRATTVPATVDSIVEAVGAAR
jgi:hypothetical protein